MLRVDSLLICGCLTFAVGLVDATLAAAQFRPAFPQANRNPPPQPAPSNGPNTKNNLPPFGRQTPAPFAGNPANAFSGFGVDRTNTLGNAGFRGLPQTGGGYLGNVGANNTMLPFQAANGMWMNPYMVPGWTASNPWNTVNGPVDPWGMNWNNPWNNAWNNSWNAGWTMGWNNPWNVGQAMGWNPYIPMVVSNGLNLPNWAVNQISGWKALNMIHQASVTGNMGFNQGFPGAWNNQSGWNPAQAVVPSVFNRMGIQGGNGVFPSAPVPQINPVPAP